MKLHALVEALWKDLRYARVLRKSPGFSTVAIASLALGIGANTALFSLVDTLMLRSLPVPHPEQLVQLAMVSTEPTANGKAADPSMHFSYPVFEQIRDRNDVFAGVCAMLNHDQTSVTIDDRQEPVDVHVVTGTYFSVLGIQPVAGRFFSSEADRAGAETLAVMSYGFWERRFARDPHVLGKKIVRRNMTFTVIGVAPRGFQGVEVGSSADFWVPLIATSTSTRAFFGMGAHGMWGYRLLARTRPGLSRKQVDAGMDVRLSQVLRDEDVINRTRAGANASPEDLARFTRRRAMLLPAGSGLSNLRQQYSQPLFILLSVVGLVLLIACANIANLLLARAAARRREIAVRLAIGAGPARLFRQLLTESLLLAVAGAAAGLLFAFWAGQALVTMVLGATPSTIHFQADWRVLAFLTAVSLVTGLLFGAGPAWRASRLDVSSSLKSESTVLGGRRPSRAPIGPALVVFQVALSLVLLVGAILFAGTLRRLVHQEIGFDRSAVVLAECFGPTGGQRTPQVLAALDRLMETVRGMPGVQSAGISDLTIFGGGTISYPVFVEGRTREQTHSADVLTMSPEFLDTMRTPVVQGRGFTARDDGSAPKVAMVNEAMARRFFPGESPIGKRFGLAADAASEREIVGVVRDMKWGSLREAAPPFVYLPMRQAHSDVMGATLSVRVGGDASGLIPAIRREVQDAHIFNTLRMNTQATLVERTLGQELLLAKLSGFFGALGLLLAGVGLFGLMSYAVSHRTREFGLRVALGAQPADLVRSVLRQSAMLVALGLAAGSVVSLTLGRLVKDFLYQIAPEDPAVTAIAAIVLMTAALVAAWIPARRASRVDPMVALRHD